MKKALRSIILAFVILTITGATAMAQGFDVEFYQALEGREITILDMDGNVIESQIVDAMGRASFDTAMQDGYTMEMDLNEAMDVDTMKQGVVYGVPTQYVMLMLIVELFLVLLLTKIYYKQKTQKKYEFLFDYEYNANLDKDND